jgi:hypothetical protein
MIFNISCILWSVIRMPIFFSFREMMMFYNVLTLMRSTLLNDSSIIRNFDLDINT